MEKLKMKDLIKMLKKIPDDMYDIIIESEPIQEDYQLWNNGIETFKNQFIITLIEKEEHSRKYKITSIGKVYEREMNK